MNDLMGELATERARNKENNVRIVYWENIALKLYQDGKITKSEYNTFMDNSRNQRYD